MGKPQQIIAMGGGGFSMEPENLALDSYILSATGAARPKVCFIGTASGDSQVYIDRFYTSMRTLPCEPSHLSLFKLEISDFRSFVLGQDAIYVGGGATRNLLVLWREWGLDTILREAWETGVVLAGISAGSICWFEHGLSDSVVANELRPLACLGFLPGSNCPHYDGEADRRPTYQHYIRSAELPPGYAAEDGAALHFVGRELARVVTSRPEATAYRLGLVDGEIKEVALPAELLPRVERAGNSEQPQARNAE